MGELPLIDKIVKIVLFVTNILIWLAGIAMLGVGIYVLVDKDVLRLFEFMHIDFEVPQELVGTSAYILIAVGILIGVLGFLGCFGAIKGNVCMLRLYGLFIFVLLVIQITAGILGVIYYDKVVETFMGSLKTFMQEQYDGVSTLSQSFDYYQKELKCCGADSPADWENSKWRKSLLSNATLTIPESCCRFKDGEVKPRNPTNCQKEYTKLNSSKSFKDLRRKGCSLKIFREVKSYTTLVVAVAFALVILQILAIVFACSLSRAYAERVYPV